jgi:hypothetical protein
MIDHSGYYTSPSPCPSHSATPLENNWHLTLQPIILPLTRETPAREKGDEREWYEIRANTNPHPGSYYLVPSTHVQLPSKSPWEDKGWRRVLVLLNISHPKPCRESESVSPLSLSLCAVSSWGKVLSPPSQHKQFPFIFLGHPAPSRKAGSI